MKLSIVMPAYNEATTLREIVARVLAVDLPGVEKELADRRRRLARTGRARSCANWTARTACARSSTPGTPARERPSGPACAPRRETSSSSRTRISSTTRASIRCSCGRSSRARRTSCTARASSERARAPRALLLALGRQLAADADVERLHEPQPDGHGDLLQGDDPRGRRPPRPPVPSGSGSSRRSPARWRG